MFEKSVLTTCFLLALLWSLSVWPQPAEERNRLHVMLSSHPDAPTPADIVDNWDFSSSAPTPGLNVEGPLTAWYLLPVRAVGDFKSRLEANPSAPRAKLERYIVVEYPNEADLENAIDSLDADVNIEAVFKPKTSRLLPENPSFRRF